MTIDAHAYWDSGHMSLEELQLQMQAHGLTKVILSPPCTLVCEPDKNPRMYALQRVLLQNDLLRLFARCASTSFYNRKGQLRALWRLFTASQAPLNKVMNPDNTGLLEAIEPFDDFYAWYWLNPGSMPPGERMLVELGHPRVVGIKLHAYWHPFEAREARAAFQLAQEIQKPVYWILGFGWLKSLVELLREFPSVPVVFGYGGFPYFDRQWQRIKDFPNAFIDLTSFHLDENIISRAVQTLGSKRCLFGSDCPYNFKGGDSRFDYTQTFDRIRNLGLEEEAQDRIFFKNARMLLFENRKEVPTKSTG